MPNKEHIYAFARADALARFAASISGDTEAFFVCAHDATLGQDARTALCSSAEALGWKPTFVSVDDPTPFTKADLFEAVEGLDPIALVIAGAKARELTADAYACEIPAEERFRLFGRDACAFDNLDALVLNDAGKQRAWTLLKGLPRAPR